MNSLDRIKPDWFLRFTLGVMYLYSGIDLLRHPTSWTWALPPWVQGAIETVMPMLTYIKIQGMIEILLALVFFAWFLNLKIVRWAALLSALEMVGILFLSFTPFKAASFLITFRDIGVLGASGALFLILSKTSESRPEIGQMNNRTMPDA